MEVLNAVLGALKVAGLIPRLGLPNHVYTRIFVARPAMPYWAKGKRLEYATTEDIGHVDVLADGVVLRTYRAQIDEALAGAFAATEIMRGVRAVSS